MHLRSTLAALTGTLCASVLSQQANNTLEPFVLQPLPLGSIKPSGWLQDQLQLMSDGLAGHEHDFYAYVAHSSWLGGDEEYSDLNEGFPYWFNGLVPLAYALDDERLKVQVHSAASYVLDHQADDGWIGPEVGDARIFWGRFPLCLGLTQLAEANSTWTQPVVDSLQRFTALMHTMLSDNYTGYINTTTGASNSDDFSWGRVRSQDMSITLQWLYEKYPGNQSKILLDNMKMLHDAGLNWEDWYNEGAYFGQGIDKDLNTISTDITAPNYPFEHGVNVGQGFKAVAVVRRFTHNDSLVQTAMDGVNWTMTNYGAASGTVLADERLVGLSPFAGSELCTSVETMYSLSYLYQTMGNNYYADRAGLAAFNSLPAMLTPDWWARQYMQQPNQPYAENLTKTPFYNTNSWGQTFGLEPNYPCCTVNHPQGWPKFLSNSYAQVGDNSVAHMLLSPGSTQIKLASGSVNVSCETGYPFMDTLSYIVTADADMEFYVRVPAWAGEDSSVRVLFNESTRLSPDSLTRLHKLSLAKGTSNISYMLTSSIRTEPRANETIAVYNGAVLYALDVTNTNTSTSPKPYNHPDEYFNASYAPPESRDWEYHNTSAWNIAIDPSTLTFHALNDFADPIFAPDSGLSYITAQGCEIDWPLWEGSVPGYPPTGDAKKCIGEVKEVKLLPYASVKTHMAELPTIDLS